MVRMRERVKERKRWRITAVSLTAQVQTGNLLQEVRPAYDTSQFNNCTCGIITFFNFR